MTARLEAPAKLTLSLRVTGVRGDGFHLIDAEMVSLDLHDVVHVTVAPTTTLSVDGPFAEGVPVDASNLVARALASCGRTALVRVTKNIPHGGGLGGGSTDAAAVLRWAGMTDRSRAAELGADVAFCLTGGRARVTGIGEVVEALPPEPRTVTLVVPPLRASTPLVYRTWDEMGGPAGDNGNDLEPAALVAVPGLALWRDAIGEATGVRPMLAGSGATWFLHGDRSEELAALSADRGAVVVVTGTRGGGAVSATE